MLLSKNELAARILESAADYGIITLDLNGRITSWNEGASHLLGWSKEEAIGKLASIFFLDEDKAAGIPEKEMNSALINGRGIDERWHVRKGGSRFWGSGEMMPLKTAEGNTFGFLKIFRDRTREHQTERRLQEQQGMMRLIADALPVGMALLDKDERYLFANLVYERQIGAPEGIIGKAPREVLPEVNYAARKPMLERVLAGEHVRFDGEWTDREGMQHIWDTQYIPKLDESGAVDGFFVLAADVTKQKASEDLQATVNKELAHRMKNLLAVVQAIANQTLRDAVDSKTALAHFSQRLNLLSTAHELLVSGAGESALVHEIVANAVFPHSPAGDERIEMGGPNIQLNSQSALSLSLVLHELATNALKYGSLSAPNGRVEVKWSVQEEGEASTFRLAWTERGGPPILPPQTKGFGSKLIAGGISGVSSRVQVHYASGGMEFSVEVPLAGILSEDGKNLR